MNQSSAQPSSTDDNSTLSPAIAGMVASLVIPKQYAAVMQVTIDSLNDQCPSSVTYIGK